MDDEMRAGGGSLHAVLVALREIVLVVDRDRVVRYINRVEPGYDRDEVIGRSSDTVIPPESRGRFQAAIDSVIATGEPADYEVAVTAPDGTTQWYTSELLPLPNQGEDAELVVVVARNTTELKAAQKETEQLRRLLPLCSWCGRILTDDGEWVAVEEFLASTGDTKVTHSLCPDCEARELGGSEASEAGAV